MVENIATAMIGGDLSNVQGAGIPDNRDMASEISVVDASRM